MLWKSVKQWITTKDKREQLDNADAPLAEQKQAELVFDPHDAAFIENPYAIFDRLRRDAPVFRNHLGAWVLTRHDDVVTALADPKLVNTPAPYAVINQRNAEKYVCAEVANNTLPFIEGEQHTRLRKALLTHLRELLKQHLPDIRLIAQDILRTNGQGGRFDVFHDYATPLALTVLCRVMGFSENDKAQLKIWSDYFFYLFTSMPSQAIRQATDQALVDFRRYVETIVEQRKQMPTDDLISRLVHSEDFGVQYSERELVDNCMLIFADGIGNVDSGLTNAVYILLKHPQQLERLRADKSLISQAINECLRYESPAQFIARIASEDVLYRDQLIKKNQVVLLVLASANRDPEQFAEADQFDIERSNSNTHLSFGRGSHSCLGAYLVKWLLQGAIEALLEETSALKCSATSVEWQARLGHRWLKGLEVEFLRKR